MLSLVPELLVNIAHIGKVNEGELGHSRILTDRTNWGGLGGSGRMKGSRGETGCWWFSLRSSRRGRRSSSFISCTGRAGDCLFKTGHCKIQIRPQGVKTGQRLGAHRNSSAT